ncbi:phytoene desaturase family protein [Lutibaculum baratangense]|uniref:Pyridine nucleotide-disulfide oxidoreductase domain-containing protein 2 n=1 Tax=Lutibaculum baratangense AMV1 TaxID=631454 RepID=V4QXS1_9HYPH|nr:NAD(P)/FAD-dependent oxidoreductase [Lutibaculum baratangense]ESR24537.1 Beta-carotene ketolase [Lutibaculum baratangense AMV1]
MEAFLHDLLSNVRDLVMDEMPDGPLAGMLGADAVLGGWAAPRSPGTVLSLMYRMAQGGRVSLPEGGMGSVTEALATAAAGSGAEIVTGRSVERITVHGDRATGVALDDGMLIGADLVLCSSSVGHAMRLAGVEHFDAEAARRIRHVRARGAAAKINLVLSQAPGVEGLSDEQTAGRLLLAPSLEYIERAFNPAKYGEMSKAPLIEAVIPTLSDRTLAPEGTHVLSAIVQYVPHGLAGGWSDEAKRRLLDLTLDALTPFMPGLRETMVHADILSPVDIEAMTGAPGGHWHHGELTVDQMLMLRPANGIGRYATGLPGLYLCGAGAHPGGDVTGSPGRNAALQALKDEAAAA